MKDPFSINTHTPSNLRIKRTMQSGNLVMDFYEEAGSRDDSEYDEFLGRSIEASNLKWLLLILIIGLAILILRSFNLQVQKGDYYNLLSEGNRIRKFVIPASRGIVFDKNEELLVRNIPRFSVYITVADLPAKAEDYEDVLKKLTELIAIEMDDIKNIIEIQKEKRAIYQPISIKDNLSHDEALKLKIAIKDLAGVNLEVNQQREYLSGNNLSAIMGYVGRINEEEYDEKKEQGYLINDIIGKAGIEYSYETVIRGVNGFEQVEVDALGKKKKVLGVEKPTAGSNLYLTIDKEFQDQVSSILQDNLKKHGKRRASVVILNPQNGKILSLLSLPTYDNNLFAQGISQQDYQQLLDDPDKPLFFRAIAGEYASGSTIKPVWSAAALQEGIITPQTSILSTGGINVYKWHFPDWRAGGHGQTNVKKAIADSVNTFYYYISGGYNDFKGMGIKKMGEYAKLFNIGELTGISLPGERAGLFPSEEWKLNRKGEVWYIGDTYHVSIGQGDLLATPLQVAIWTAFFANKGKIFKPQVVDKINQNERIIEIPPEIIREGFIDDEYIEVVKQGMRQGVTQGSSKYLYDLPVKVGGKTGTAQWNKNKDNHAWWTGFAPYDNPEIVVTILVEEGGEGSRIAVPIAKEIIRWWWENRGRNF
jgi:penicillin-binding protein 2